MSRLFVCVREIVGYSVKVIGIVVDVMCYSHGLSGKGHLFLERVLVVLQKVVDCGSECINVVVGAMRYDKRHYDY